MKKIICLTESLMPGGAERQMANLAVLLKQQNYNVSVWTYYPHDFYRSLLIENNVEYKYIPEAKGKLNRLPVLYELMKQAKPDCVIAYLDTACMVTCCLKALGLKAKVIVSERNTTQSLTLRERLKFFLYRYADCIVPNSETQASFIKGHYPSLARKVTTITNFVDLDKFVPESHTFKDKKLDIISVGRIMPQKNPLLLIRAIGELRADGLDISTDWYGNVYEQDLYQECLLHVKRYGIENHFRIHDASPNIVSKYQESDAFCLTSIYEGFPNVLCEAMSCGLPIICSDVCDNPSIVKNEENAFLFKSNNIDELKAAIRTLYHYSAEKKMEMAKASRLLAEKQFSKSLFVNKYKTLINE